MSYENAKKGIGQIFTAEILQLVSAILVLIGSIAAVVGVAAIVGGGIVGVGLTAIGGILSLIGFIMYIVGVGNAAKDEQNFKRAMMFLVLGLICSVVGAFTGTVANGVIRNILSILAEVFQLISAVYVIEGIISLAGKVANPVIESKGRSTLKQIVVVIIISIIASLISLFTSPVAAVVSAILVVIATIMSVIKYFIYLGLLSGARKMFD